MTLGVYVFPVLMLVFVGWIVVRELPGVRRRWKLEKRIGEIGQQAALGLRERITGDVIAERRR